MPKARARAPKPFTPLQLEYVALSDLERWPRNPKEHDLGLLHTMMDEFGYTTPVMIDEDTGKMVAGHGRVEVLLQKKAGGRELPDHIMERDGEWYVPVVRGVHFETETRAEAYIVGDNQSTILGGWNQAQLATVLRDLYNEQMIAPTGFDGQDLNDMLRNLGDAMIADAPSTADLAARATAALRAPRTIAEQSQDRAAGKRIGGVARAAKPQGEPDKLNEPQETALANLENLQELEFLGNNEFGVPELRDDMLLQSVPAGLATWGNEYKTPDRPGQWWFFPGPGAARATGIPMSRTVWGFFTWDEYFEDWWNYPAYNVAKAMANGLTTIVTPDFSIWQAAAPAVWIYNAYRSRWLGRYFQECGLTVVPHLPGLAVQTPRVCDLGLPPRVPVVMVNLQTKGDSTPEQLISARLKNLRLCVKNHAIETVCVYAAKKTRELVMEQDIGCEIVGLGTAWEVVKLNEGRAESTVRVSPGVRALRRKLPAPEEGE